MPFNYGKKKIPSFQTQMQAVKNMSKNLPSVSVLNANKAKNRVTALRKLRGM